MPIIAGYRYRYIYDIFFFHVYLIVPTEVNGKAIELKVKGVWTMLSIREIYCVTCGLFQH